MAKYAAKPSGREVFFESTRFIVSKTDLKGRITYANDVFLEVAGYREDELLGAPHSIVRHPDMPRAVFKLLWDEVGAGREVFAYVKNMTKSGDHYWVLAHVTPTYDAAGATVGYHSNRRAPRREAVEKIEPLYAALLAEEARHANARDGMAAAGALLSKTVADSDMPYEELVLAL